MKNTEFEKMVRSFREKQDELIISKGHDYTVGNGDSDRLWNFKTVAEMIGITPMQALGVYWLKHVLAICTYIKLGKVESEDIDGRFLDESNYNLLGRALIHDLSRNSSKGLYSALSEDQLSRVPEVYGQKPSARNKRKRARRKKV
jgi:hypothetical protein